MKEKVVTQSMIELYNQRVRTENTWCATYNTGPRYGQQLADARNPKLHIQRAANVARQKVLSAEMDSW